MISYLLTLWRLDEHVSLRSPNTDLLPKFFWRIFKRTEIFPIFSFFHFMISPPNRLFLAYLRKKIFRSKFYGLVDFFHITIFFQISSRTSIRLLYSNLIEIFAACLHPQTTLFLKFSFFSCNVQGHSDVIIFAILRFFYFMISPPNRPYLTPNKFFPCYFYGLVNF